MQNHIKSETRLAFIQFIFSSLFSNSSFEENMNDFENYFYKLSVPSIKKNKEILINFNKNYFKKLTKSYDEFIKHHNIEHIIIKWVTCVVVTMKWKMKTVNKK